MTTPELPAGARQTIRLGNRDFELERVKVPVAHLKLDPQNQRLSYLLQRKGGELGDAELQELIWQMDPVKDLYTSIYQNGGLISDPIIKRNGVVVEGNCRTVCLRQLHDRFPNDDRWREVFVQTLPAEASEEQLTMLIGELHIAGKIEWRAFEQAEYVWKMSEQFGKTIDFLASHLRWSRLKVQQKISAYQQTKLYMQETDDPDGINRFSHFEEFAKKKELRARSEAQPEFEPLFRRWVYEGKFPDAKDVRELPEILGNEAASRAFMTGGVLSSRAVLHVTNPALVSNLWATVDRAISELRNAPLIEVEDLQRGHSAKVSKLRDLHAAVKSLSQQAHIDLTQQD
jgi:hypothetical protein